MKKLFLLLILVLVMVACSNNKPKLTILGENSSSIQSMESLKDDYEKTHQVQLNFKPNTFEDAFNKANQDFANKTGLYDIVLQYNFSLSSFVKNNYVITLDELKSKDTNPDYSFENDIFDNIWKEVGYYYSNPQNPDDKNIKPIAYPFAANTMLLVYNKELFNDPAQRKAYKAKYGSELEVPTDLPSFQRVAQFFTQPDKGLYGVCLQGATGGWLYYEWCNFVQSSGGKIFDKDQGWKGNSATPVLLTSPAVSTATQYYVSLKPYNAGNFTTTDAVEQRNILKKGKVAMGLIWSDYMWGLIDKGNGKFDERFGFAPIPGIKSMIAGGSYYINRQSKEPQFAFAYIKYLLQKDNQIKMIKKGLCSPVRSAYDAPEVQSIPYIKALKTSLERAEYMLEAGSDADLVNNVITTHLQKIWNGSESIDDGLRLAKTEIEKERIKFFQ
jgi:multiple sugar transport system substrate-binding protein